jgi:hypothetical protein
LVEWRRSQEDATATHGAENAHLGDKGELWFAAQLPQGWVWQPPRRDLGKDGLVVIRDGSRLQNLEFTIQVKTTSSPTIRGECVVVSGLRRSSVQYWFASPLPTLVVVLDASDGRAWFAWHLDLFPSPAEVFGGSHSTLTIHVPTKNRLDQAGWERIRQDLVRHFSALQEALSSESLASHLLKTLYSIARITGNLMRLATSAVPRASPTEEQGIALLIEQVELRDLMSAVRSLLDRIDPECEGRKQIEYWLASFEAMALGAHPTIDRLPSGPNAQFSPDFEFAFAPKLVREARPRLVLAAVDLMRILAQPRVPSGRRDPS